jgi:uncharacterized membrane protein YhdT
VMRMAMRKGNVEKMMSLKPYFEIGCFCTNLYIILSIYIFI